MSKKEEKVYKYSKRVSRGKLLIMIWQSAYLWLAGIINCV